MKNVNRKYFTLISVFIAAGIILTLQICKSPRNNYKTENIFYDDYSIRMNEIKNRNVLVTESKSVSNLYPIDLENPDTIKVGQETNREEDSFCKAEKAEESYVSEDKPLKYNEYSVDNHNSFKSYMDKDKVTSKQSKQYKLLKTANVDYNTGIYTINDRYCIAMGSGFNVEVGDNVDLIMENSSTVECIISDIKADKDTDSSNRYHLCDNSIVEFVVSTKDLSKKTKQMGDVSYADKTLRGKVQTVRVYKERN